MFGKEAEKYIKANNLEWELECHRTSPIAEVSQAFQKGAEFGYNKAFVEADKNLKAVVADFNKANEWHNIRENPNDLPTDTSALYYVLVYSWTFEFSHLYKRYGIYIPAVCEWNGKYFKALDKDAYTNARNIKNCIAWKEIVLPKEIK